MLFPFTQYWLLVAQVTDDRKIVVAFTRRKYL